MLETSWNTDAKMDTLLMETILIILQQSVAVMELTLYKQKI